MHNTEDTLLHFTSVLSTQDDNLVVLEVNLDSALSGQVLDGERSLEFTSIENVEIDFLVITEILNKLLGGRGDEHVLHEESVVRSAADNSDFESVLGIPSSVSIDNIKSGLLAEILDGKVSAELVAVGVDGDVDITPPDGVLGGLIENDSLFLGDTSGSLTRVGNEGTS